MLEALRFPSTLEASSVRTDARGHGGQLPRPRRAAGVLLLPRALPGSPLHRRAHQLHPGRAACSTRSPGCSGALRPARCCRSSRSRSSRLRNDKNGGLLTLGMLGTIWSTSSGDDRDHRHAQPGLRHPGGPALVEGAADCARPHHRAGGLHRRSRSRSCSSVRRWPKRSRTGSHLGPVFTWTWKILQWPVVFGLVALAHRADLLLRTRCRAGVGLDHAGLALRHRALAADLARVQVLRRALHVLHRDLRH